MPEACVVFGCCITVNQNFTGLKTGINFAHFGLESGMVFEETTGVYERIHRFNSK